MNEPKSMFRGVVLRSTLIALILGFTVGGACAAQEQPLPTDIREMLADSERTGSPAADRTGRSEALRVFYSRRDFAPLWSRDGSPTPQALAMMQILRTAQNYGLRPQDYSEGLGGDPSLVAAAGNAARIRLESQFDIALSAAVMQFLTHLHFGRVDPKVAGFNLGSSRPPLNLVDLILKLATTISADEVIAPLEPQFFHYALLKQALGRYRLLASGTATASASELLTAPYDRRVRQIELTLERWRWLPKFDSPPIIVNIPQFRLFAFQSTRDRKAEILQMDVIVGRTYPKLRTPVFVADMKYVIFRPYWDIPYSITEHEMLPAIRANPDYLRRQHLEIVRGSDDATAALPPVQKNIDALAAGTLRLRQQPGNDNALGLMKFMFPNTYNVYLHSTPAHQLFSRARRAFSHGCIRVSDPAALAAYVLRNASGSWTPESIAAAMNGPGTLRVQLTKPIRVMILYGTALATEDGAVMFFEDIYGHDKTLEALLGLPPVVDD